MPFLKSFLNVAGLALLASGLRAFDLHVLRRLVPLNTSILSAGKQPAERNISTFQGLFLGLAEHAF